MSRPHSANKHVMREPFTRTVISEFGGYMQIPVPAAPAAIHAQTLRTTDPAKAARMTMNPAKAAAGHLKMDTREYGIGGDYGFRGRVGGVVPGYAGHRPGARDLSHTMAFGGVPTFNPPQLNRPPGQGQSMNNRPTTAWQEYGHGWKQEEPDDSRTNEFRDTVGGVLCGYTGFVPNARTHCGSIHVGGLSQVGSRGRIAQRGHSGHVERLQGDKALDLRSRTERTAAPMVGYAGHLPKSMDAFGMSYFRDHEPNAGMAQAELYNA